MPSLVRKRSRGGDRASQAPKMRRSCDACAFAKRKCDGEVCCSLCRKKAIPCVYSKRQKSGPKVNTLPERGSAGAKSSAASRTSPKADKRLSSNPPATAAGPQLKKQALSSTASSRPYQPQHKPQQKAEHSSRKKQDSVSSAGGSGSQQRKKQKKQQQQHHHHHQQQEQQNTHGSSLLDADRSQVACPSPKAGIAGSRCPPAAAPKGSSSLSPKKHPPAKALPRQQPKTVAKKEPRPRHKHEDDGGRRASSSANETLAARAAVISPVKNGGGRNTSVVAPPVLPPLAAKPEEKAATASAASAAELVPLPPLDPQRRVLPTTSSPAAPAVSSSESSMDGGSSSLSWDDVSDVFASNMEDDVLWSCDDLSETGAGGGGVGMGNEEFFSSGSSTHGRQPKLDAMQAVSPTAVEAVLLNDDESEMSWPTAYGFGIQQPQSSSSSSPPPPRPLSPQIYQKRSSLPDLVSLPERSPIALHTRDNGCASEGVVQSAASGSTKGHHHESFRNNSPGIVHPGDSASNPISSWTPEAVEAGASTLLAVLTGMEFCGRDGSTGEGCVGEGLWQQQNQQGLRQQQNQQQRQQNSYLLGRSNGNNIVDEHDNARQSLRWPPNHSIPACDGRLADYGGMVPRSPPSTPSRNPSFAPSPSRQYHRQQQRYQQHQDQPQHHHRQQQQQQQQQQRVPTSLNTRSSVSVMPTSSDGNCGAPWSRNGSERHHVATL